MTVDGNSSEVDKVSSRWSASVKIVSPLAAAVGAIAAVAQGAQYLVDGRFNLVLSAICAVVGALGIAGLFTMKDRRAAMIGGIVTIGIILAGSGAVYFVRLGTSAGPPSLAAGPSSSRANPPYSTSPSVLPSGPSPVPVTTGVRGPSVTPPTTRSSLPVPPSLTAKVQGTIDDPIDGQQVTGSRLSAKGTVESSSLALLCITKDESGNYFPYAAQVNGRAWSSGISIGPNRVIDRPYSFTLILATATVAAVDDISRQQKENPEYNVKGLGPVLPEGISPLATIKIVRVS